MHVCWLMGHCINDQAKQHTIHASVTLRPIKPSLACATQNGDGTSHIMAALLMLQYGMILLKPTKTLRTIIRMRKSRESHGNPISPLQGLGMKLAGRVEAVSFDEGLNDVAASGTSVFAFASIVVILNSATGWYYFYFLKQPQTTQWVSASY